MKRFAKTIEHIRGAEALIAAISENTDITPTAWHELSLELARATAALDHVRIGDDPGLLIREVLLERVERMTRRVIEDVR